LEFKKIEDSFVPEERVRAVLTLEERFFGFLFPGSAGPLVKGAGIMRLSHIHRFLVVIAMVGGTSSFALGQANTLSWPPIVGGTPPTGYNVNTTHRKPITFHYEAKAEIPPTDKELLIGPTRTALVITPIGYNPKISYPVLYLLHGFYGDETSWTSSGDALCILDNLQNAGKIVPMIVVMPDNYASTVAPDYNDMPAVHKAYQLFEKELINDLIPQIEANFSTIASPKGRALAGCSEGAEQAVKFGLENLDTFGYIGAFSPNGDLMSNDLPPGVALGPQNFVPAGPIPNIENLRLFWLSCGTEDLEHYTACGQLVTALNQSTSFTAALNAPLSYTVRPISWGTGADVPKKGKNLILVGTDLTDQLHIRIFDGSGKLFIDWDEAEAKTAQEFDVMILKERLVKYGSVLTDDEAIQIITEVSSIVNDPIPVLNPDLRLYPGPHNYTVFSPSLYHFLQDLSWDRPIY
jgi:hypothetical protein